MKYPKIAEYGQVKANGWPCSQESILDSVVRTEWHRSPTVNLVQRKAGYSIAGSAMRWDTDSFGTIWESDGSRYGSWFKTESEARAAFAKHVDKANNPKED